MGSNARAFARSAPPASPPSRWQRGDLSPPGALARHDCRPRTHGATNRMAGRNVLFIMSDEHSRRVLGAYGNESSERRISTRWPRAEPCSRTPTVIARSACPRGPVSRPAATCNSRLLGQRIPLHGHPARLSATGCTRPGIAAIPSASCTIAGSGDPNGFDNEILPLHVLDGRGDVQGMLRRPPPPRSSTKQLAGDAGAGNSTYLDYDRSIRDAAVDGCARRRNAPEQPWCLFVSFVCPHFPLVAPPEFFPLSARPGAVAAPASEEFPDHPVLQASCARCRTIRTISVTRLMSAPPLPPITAWSRSSMTISAGCWSAARRRPAPTTPW